MEGFWIKLNQTGKKILVSQDNQKWDKASYSMLVDIIIYLANKKEMDNVNISQN